MGATSTIGSGRLGSIVAGMVQTAPPKLSASAMAARGTHERVLALLAQEPDVRRVLDIPCGQGVLCARLAEHGYDVTGADIVARQGSEKIRFVAADMNGSLPCDDGELDAVLCVDGIEHIERPYDFAAECARVVRKGGVVIWSTPNISSLRSRWRFLWTGFHNGRKTPLDELRPNPLHHINMLEFHKLRYMLHRVGFKITAVTTNRYKAATWLFLPLVPFAWLMTRFVFAYEIRDEALRPIWRETFAQMFSRPVLFGDALVVKAVRT
jgi:2-polyprenyl-3-methyl-5-hydroxy-6-metoxy-1,4-benzoquinol methylase